MMKLKFSLRKLLNVIRVNLDLYNKQKYELWEKAIFNILKSMSNNKTPGNDKLSREFYEAFCNKLKDSLLKLFYYAKTYKEFSKSQRQTVSNSLKGRTGRV